MSTKKKAAASKSTAVMVKPWDAAEGAVLVFADIEKIAELATLASESSHITSITNDAGRDQVHSLRMVLKNRRLEISETGLEARRKALSFNRGVSSQESDYIKLIQPEEDRLQTLQDDYDAKLAKEKQALIDAEIARQAALQERIAELNGNLTLLATSGSALIAEHISDLEALPVDESFEECRELAEAAKAEGLTRLRALHAAAIAYEAEQQRIADERVELARLRKEAAERAAADAERERQAKVVRDAEAARLAAQLKQQADDAAREQAARQKIVDENNARIAAEQKVAQDEIDAERKRQADAAAEITRQQEELRKAQEPALIVGPTTVFGIGNGTESFENLVSYTGLSTIPVPQASTADQPCANSAPSIPSREQIVAALCDHFVLDEAQILASLARIDWQEALAEAA